MPRGTRPKSARVGRGARQQLRATEMTKPYFHVQLAGGAFRAGSKISLLIGGIIPPKIVLARSFSPEFLSTLCSLCLGPLTWKSIQSVGNTVACNSRGYSPAHREFLMVEKFSKLLMNLLAPTDLVMTRNYPSNPKSRGEGG
jgi:hypothetical protein